MSLKTKLFLFISIWCTGSLSAQVHESDSLALLVFYDSTGGADWHTTWDLSQPVSTWHGIRLQGTRVIELEVSNNNLSGTLPAAIGDLDSLRSFVLNNPASLTGILPVSLLQLPKLTTLTINTSDLKQELPEEIFEMTQLEVLSLGGRQDAPDSLRYPLPSTISQLTSLRELRLSFWGINSIPPAISELISLESLSLRGAKANQPIFEYLYDLVNLKELDLAQSFFVDTLSANITSWPQLRNLSLNDSEFHGTIPPEIGLLPLSQFFADRANFSGTIPIELTNCPLRILSLTGNSFVGAVPQALSTVATLEHLHLGDNQFTDLPDLSALNLINFSASRNYFEFDDLIINQTLFDQEHDYAPQNSPENVIEIELIGSQDTTVQISTWDDGTNEYSWQKNGQYIAGAEDSTLVIGAGSESGVFRAEATNSQLPGLTLYSEFFDVAVFNPDFEGDSLILLDLYNETWGWDWLVQWDLTASMSEWHGITLGEFGVTEINLEGNNLKRSLPNSILGLGFLERLNLRNNGLSNGPPSLVLLNRLKYIDLSENDFLYISGLAHNDFDTLDVSGNRLDFFDLRPFASDDLVFRYAPQDSLGYTRMLRLELDAEIELKQNNGTIEDDQFEWYRNGIFLPDSTNSSMTVVGAEEDLGNIDTVWYSITNPAFPELTLHSYSIIYETVPAVSPTNIHLTNHVVQESNPVGHIIGELQITDPNPTDTTFTIIVGSTDDFFVTGNLLRATRPFTFSEEQEVNLFVRAMDQDGNFLTERFTIEIQKTPETDSISAFQDGRSGAISLVIDDIPYIGLGENASGFLTDFWSYNFDSAKWIEVAPFPGGSRTQAAAFVIDGMGYVGVGMDQNDVSYADFYQYDPLNDEWSAISNFSGTPRHGAVAFALGAQGYVGTGRDAVGETNDFWAYDPTSDQWSQKATLSSGARYGASAFVIDEVAYVTGGVEINGGTTQFSDVQSYDAATDSWEEQIFADGLNLPMVNATATAANGQGYILYGNQDHVARYDPTDNSVENLGDLFDLGGARWNPVSFVAGEYLYFGLGLISGGIGGTDEYPINFTKHQIPTENVNEAPLDIFLTEKEIDENKHNGTVGQLVTFDPNASDTHTYTFEDTGDLDNDLFTIEDGLLKWEQYSFDFETRKNYMIRVRSTDGDGLSLTKDFELSVTDQNDSPRSPMLSNNTSELSTSSDVPIGTLSAEDPDGDPLEFVLLESEFSHLFEIRNDSNLHKSQAPSSYEVRDYELSIRVLDGRGRTLTAFFTVTIEEDNVAPSAIVLGSSEIDEQQEENIVVASISTTDENELDTHTYQITTSPSGYLQLVDNLIVTTDQMVLHHELQSIDIMINTTDQKGLSLAEDFVMTVNNINDAPVGMTLSGSEVAEHLPAGTVVGMLATEDIDLGDTHTYSVAAGSEFSIDGMSLVTAEELDFEIKSRHQINIVSTDAGGLSFTQAFDIDVLDGEDPLGTAPAPKIKVYPNPATSFVNVSGLDQHSGELSIRLMTLTGKAVMTLMTQSNAHKKRPLQIDVSELSPGVYFLLLQSEKVSEKNQFFIQRN